MMRIIINTIFLARQYCMNEASLRRTLVLKNSYGLLAASFTLLYFACS